MAKHERNLVKSLDRETKQADDINYISASKLFSARTDKSKYLYLSIKAYTLMRSQEWYCNNVEVGQYNKKSIFGLQICLLNRTEGWLVSEVKL